jgi:hypothetical protein
VAKQNRETLKRFFSAGKLPSEEHFADLVDSTLNTIDEGFDKSERFGFEITPQNSAEKGNNGAENLISFFRRLTDKSPSWSISYHSAKEALQFRHTDGATSAERTVLSLDKTGKVTINEEEFNDLERGETEAGRSAIKLEVGGAIRAPARLGVGLTKESSVPANGEYQPITGKLQGFQALEIVAKVELRDGRRFAIVHAIALNAYNPPWRILNFWNRFKRIKVHQAYSSGPRDRLKLRWETVKDEDNLGVDQYRLAIKSAFRYPGDAKIEYHVTRLWGADWLGAEPPVATAPEAESE